MRIHPVSTGFAGVCATLMTVMLPSSLPAQPVATIIGTRDDDVVRAAVSYADLNLAFARDRRVLNDRVWTASAQVCRKALVGALIPMHRACATRTFKDAEPQIASAIDRAAAGRVASRSDAIRIRVR
jgi:UrcA family protein